MGCDIHFMTERLKMDWETKEEKWVNCDHYKLNDYYDPEDKEDSDSMKEYEVVPVADDGRDYYMFSILADVRNYGERIIPIAQPRGVPTDVSPHIKKEIDYWNGDGHSHSYFTLKELKEWKKNNPKKLNKGFVLNSEIEKFDNEGYRPKFYWYVEQETAKHYREWEVEETVLDDLIESLEKRMKEVFRWEWEEDYSEFEDKIRIVFWFDN